MEEKYGTKEDKVKKEKVYIMWKEKRVMKG